jgi:endonuclease YncB( thermonuclease family)
MAFNHLVNADCPKIDRYRRMVCVVWVDGKDINLKQIQIGLAWHYKKYENEQQDSEKAAYAKAENEARTSKIGLWTETEPTPPWEWRKQGKR